jgi:serine/threonine protein kinase
MSLMHESIEHQAPKLLVDEYGNFHQITDELARGGQGVVFRTKDADLAIKQSLDAVGRPDTNANLRECFQNIRLLPMPARVQLSLPLAILRDEPGYVMRLLSGMKSFSSFELNGTAKKKLEDEKLALPQWMTNIPDRDLALRLFHYSNTGSTRRRLFALAKCASILARLHSAGLVYGDISTNNAFVGDDSSSEVWLIDADNMRFEMPNGGVSYITRGYGAPEVVRGIDSSRPRTDCWAFAVMAFKMLALIHPFIGKKVLEPDDEENGWDAEPEVTGKPTDLDDQAYAGYLPFVDDEDDDSNAGVSGLPRTLVTTPSLRRLFQETFGAGREHPHCRPAMAFWALELTKAADLALDCPECSMSYFADDHGSCPYCGAERPAFIRANTPRWEIVIPAGTLEFALPHRLFYPFSFEHHDDMEYESVLNFAAKTAVPARGAKAFPESLTFKFVEGGK